MQNLLIIMPDQFRTQALGFWRQPRFAAHLRGGSDPVDTPHLDALADQSLVLPQATACFPVCSPFRGMLFSGRYPHVNGVYHNCGHDRPDCYLRPDVPCLTDVLTQAGYDCGYIGKLHLDFPHCFDASRPDWYPGGWDVYTPPERRHGCTFWHSYGTFDVHKNPHYWDANGQRHDPKRWSPLYEADVAASFILNDAGQRNPARPFALTVAMNPPHTPNNSLNDCEEADFARYADLSADTLLQRPNVEAGDKMVNIARHYFAQVTGVDRAVGRILDALRDSGQAEDTVVLFLADHGEMLGSHGLNGKNRIYTESFNIPFILRAPGRVAPQIDDLLLGPVDIMPTLLGVLGLADQVPSRVAGQDFSGLWTDRPAPARPEAALYMKNMPGPRDEDEMHRGYTAVARGLQTQRHTLLVEQPDPEVAATVRVFNNDADAYQMHPLRLEGPNVPTERLLNLFEQRLTKAEGPKAAARWLEPCTCRT